MREEEEFRGVEAAFEGEVAMLVCRGAESGSVGAKFLDIAIE